DDDVEHRLKFSGRAADDVEDLTCCRLMVERLLKLAGARLDLFEQPGILDSDGRLVGEGGHKLDLFVGKRAHLRSREPHIADGDAFAHHGYAKYGAETAVPPGFFKSIGRICPNVGDVNDLALAEDASLHRAVIRLDRYRP